MYQSYQEIFGQGETLSQTFHYIQEQKKAIQDFFAPDDYDEIVLVACGSSYWGALSAQVTLQRETGRRCTAVKSGEIVLNPDFYRTAYRRPLLIAPSRSGTTEETLRALHFLKEVYGCRILAVVEYPDSPLEKLADLSLFLPWANEISICQTRSFSCLYLTQLLIASFLGDDTLAQHLETYINRFSDLSAAACETMRRLVKDFSSCKQLTVLGSGSQYGAAVEGAYIGIEMAQFPANYYSLLEYRHGPIVTADASGLLAVFTRNADRSYEIKMAAEAAEQGSRVLAVVDQGEFSNASYIFSLGYPAPDEVIALYGVFVLQAFAHFQAIALNRNPDKPGNLVPFITLGEA